MKKILLALTTASLFTMLACAGGNNHDESETGIEDSAAQIQPLTDPGLKLIYTPPDNPAGSNSVVNSPNGHAAWTDAINQAQTNVRMVMFHLQDSNVVTALKNAASRNVQVQVILDQGELKKNADLESVYEDLKNNGVDVKKSSPAFPYSHEKAMCVDSRIVFITAINLNNSAETERDIGVITTNESIINEWNSVFEKDLYNIEHQSAETPQLSVPSLLWSPQNSEEKLNALIASAKSSIVSTVENFKENTSIIDSLISAANREIQVQIMTPQCVAGNATMDVDVLNTLSNNGVMVRIMPHPSSNTQPYMHSKMILIDHTPNNTSGTNNSAYVGSVNFTNTSMQENREAGLLFQNQAAADTIYDLFQKDWEKAVDWPGSDLPPCPTPTAQK